VGTSKERSWLVVGELDEQEIMYHITISNDVIKYIGTLSEKDQRIIGGYIDRLNEHPNAPGNIKKMKTRKPRWRLHIGSKYTLFYFVDSDTLYVDHMMTQEQSHKRYGKFL
jgi:mRNA-degrading endonuclease RelE of RelBE toxin-antitoxin system